MQLKKVYFDAYKSLLDTELDIADNCIGLVGINESGKSNVLNALAVLSKNNLLTSSDKPRMASESNPALRFEFSLNNNERKTVESSIAQCLEHETVPANMLPNDYTVIYHVSFDMSKEKETRYWTVQNISLPTGTLVLKTNALTRKCKFKQGDSFIPLKKALIVTEKELEENKELVKLSEEFNHALQEIEATESAIKEVEKSIEPKGQQESSEAKQTQGAENQDISAETKSTSLNAELKEKEIYLTDLKDRKMNIALWLGDFDLIGTVSQIEGEINQLTETIQQTQLDIDSIKSKITKLQVEDPDEDQEKELNSANQKLKKLKTRLQTSQSLLTNKENVLSALKQPLRDKYSVESDDLSMHLRKPIGDVIEQFLPSVVFWEYSDNYILKGETEFSEILKVETLDEVPRPLVNLFRIGLGIENFESLKKIITKIQKDSSERNRLADTLTGELNKFIQGVWKDYDQEIRISLEQERIVVKFYDPDHEGSSYYDMQERSQGCKTFISFLLTIGAEAKKGIIRNTVLLLDEPETHLHPSGVRFMRNELLSLAEYGNYVVFATHSIFMIDRKYLTRHVIMSKYDECSSLKKAERNTITQESVIYEALGTKLDEFSIKINNLMFEGALDRIMFEFFLNQCLAKRDNLFACHDTLDGGGTKAMQKFFKDKAIPAESKWKLILDNDKPAQQLDGWLKKEYSNKFNDQFEVIYYSKEDGYELEDILPTNIIESTYNSAFKETISDFEGIFTLEDNKPSSEKAEEFARKSGITPEQMKLIDKSFKRIFREMILEKLANIEKLKTIQERLELFKDTFPDYYAFIHPLVTDQNNTSTMNSDDG